MRKAVVLLAFLSFFQGFSSRSVLKEDRFQSDEPGTDVNGMYEDTAEEESDVSSLKEKRNQDNTFAKLLHTMIIYDKNGNPHFPNGVDPEMAAKSTGPPIDDCVFHNDPLVKRNLAKAPYIRFWEDGIVPFEIDSGMSENVKERILQAVEVMSQQTCVQWIPKENITQLLNPPSHDGSVLFTSEDKKGCRSYIGRIGLTDPAERGQNITIENGLQFCERVPSILHEMMHALGFHHEHVRSDRDEHINILWDNVKASNLTALFVKQETYDRTNYDVSSLLQYHPLAGTRSGKPTMTSNDGLLEILAQTSSTLTHNDVKRITLAYNCTKNCLQKPDCQNTGFVGHRCSCVCPDVLKGVTCKDVVTDTGCGGVINLTPGQTVNITSPNYPAAYDVDAICTWLVKAPFGYNINMSFEELDLSTDYGNVFCNHWLEMRFNLPGQEGIKRCNKADQTYIITTNIIKNIFILRLNSRHMKERIPATNQRFKVEVEAVLINCNPNPCKNSGTCSSLGSKITCHCTPEWTGTTCSEKVQTCTSQTCKNGGTCIVTGNIVACVCQTGWIGVFCDVSDPCSANPCVNGGNCSVTDKTFQCVCLPSWTGQTCTEPRSFCKADTCKNGGSCSESSDGIFCSCSLEWTGKFCEGKLQPKPNASLALCSFEVDDSCWLTPFQLDTVLATDSTIPASAFRGSLYGVLRNEYFYLSANEGSLKKNVEYCLSFAYYMDMDGYLGVFLHEYDERSVWESFDSDGKWKTAAVTVSNNGDQILALYGDKSYGDRIAVDEILLKEGRCDPCANNPCENGGLCTVHVNSFKCTCTKPWTGPTCAVKRELQQINTKSFECKFESTAPCPFFQLNNLIETKPPDVTSCADGSSGCIQTIAFPTDDNVFNITYVSEEILSGQYCFSFNFYKSGAETDLKVFVDDINYFTITPHALNEWSLIEFNLDHGSTIPRITGKLVGEEFIMIDNIKLKSGIC